MRLNGVSLAIFLLIAFATVAAVAQNTDEWVRFEPNGAEFSIEMPRNAELFADKDGFLAWESGTRNGMQFAEMRMLTASADTTVMWVEIYSVVNASRAMEIAINNAELKARKLENLPKGFSGKETEKTSVYDFKNKADVPISYVSKYYASKTNLYIVTASRRGAKNATFERFFDSVRFNEANSASTKLSSMKAFAVLDVGVEPVKPTETVKTTAKPVSPDQDDDSSPMLVLMKPRAAYTDAARRKGVTGTVLLDATFQSNGRISRVELINGLSDGLNRNALFATIRMKFLPPEKNGRLENTVKKISYGFSIY